MLTKEASIPDKRRDFQTLVMLTKEASIPDKRRDFQTLVMLTKEASIPDKRRDFFALSVRAATSGLFPSATLRINSLRVTVARGFPNACHADKGSIYSRQAKGFLCIECSCCDFGTLHASE